MSRVCTKRERWSRRKKESEALAEVGFTEDGLRLSGPLWELWRGGGKRRRRGMIAETLGVKKVPIVGDDEKGSAGRGREFRLYRPRRLTRLPRGRKKKKQCPSKEGTRGVRCTRESTTPAGAGRCSPWENPSVRSRGTGKRADQDKNGTELLI